MPTAVLITGTSSGIGRATALRLARHDEFAVYATARDPKTLSDLTDSGATPLTLDVTDENSMRAAIEVIEAEHGSVGVLVNNAGYGVYGTVEEADLDQVRQQFETNLFGLARLTQLVLPSMRDAGRGRVVNVGSMGGRLVFPAGGYYHASKYALEALSDALRFEVAPFGVKVSLVEPGLIRTSFSSTAARSLAGAATPDGPYADLNSAVDRRMAHSYGSSVLSSPPDTVAKVIERAVVSPRPRARYVVTPAAKALVHIRRLFGARLFDAYLRAQFRDSR